MLRIAVLHGATLDRPDEVDTARTAEAVCDALQRLGYAAELMHLGPDMAELEALPCRRPDLVFNLVEAVGGDGALAGEVPGHLDRLGLPYTGCGAMATQRCLSKPESKRVLAAAGLPTPAWSLTAGDLAQLDRVIVKAVAEHASLGIDAGSVVPGAMAEAELVRRAARLGVAHFVEEYVEGREFNLAVLDGRAGPEVLPPAETLFVGYGDRPRIVDYEAKWAEASYAYNNTPRRFEFGRRGPGAAGRARGAGAARLDALRARRLCAGRFPRRRGGPALDPRGEHQPLHRARCWLLRRRRAGRTEL